MPLKFTDRTEEKRRACFLEVRSDLRSCRSHFKTLRFIAEKLQELSSGGVFGPWDFERARNFDLQEEFFCRNALKRLGAYNEDDDDEVYLLASAEDGNAVAQLAMADMCGPLHSASTHLPRIMLLTFAQLQLAGHDTRSCSLVQGCRRTTIS
jgi:hypothetical protein